MQCRVTLAVEVPNLRSVVVVGGGGSLELLHEAKKHGQGPRTALARELHAWSEIMKWGEECDFREGSAAGDVKVSSGDKCGPEIRVIEKDDDGASDDVAKCDGESLVARPNGFNDVNM